MQHTEQPKPTPSSSHERKVQGYLKPKVHAMFEGYVKEEKLTDSSALNTIVREFFTRMPEKDRNHYLRRGAGK